jgi:predicted transposase/invertase (TIGR01784 family)
MPAQIKNINLDYTYTIIDMKTIDCDYFLQQDTPDALVLAILCDFKQRNPSEIVGYIIDRLQEYTKDNTQEFRKYMMMLEELSTNRDLKNIVKEQEMLSTLRYEDLPSYEIGMEKGIERGMERGRVEGMERGIEKGMEKGKTETSYELAKKMKQEGIEIKMIAKITGLSIQTIEKLS